MTKELWKACWLLLFGAIVVTNGAVLNCEANNPGANDYCADYCYSIHRGRHVAGLCVRDEISCICETEGNGFIKVRVLQGTEPAPYVEPTIPPMLFPQVPEVYLPVATPPENAYLPLPVVTPPENVYMPLPATPPPENQNPGGWNQNPVPMNEPQELVCDGSVEAWNVCNSFCIDIIRASSGTCVTENSTCRCSNVPDGRQEGSVASSAPLNPPGDGIESEYQGTSENQYGNAPVQAGYTFGQNYHPELPPPQLPSFYSTKDQTLPTMQVPLPFEQAYPYDGQGYYPAGLATDEFVNPGGGYSDGGNPVAGFYAHSHYGNPEGRGQSMVEGPLEIAPRSEVSVE